MSRPDRVRACAVAGLSFTLIEPSLSEVTQYAGVAGALVFVALSVTTVAALPRICLTLESRLRGRRADWAAIVTVALVLTTVIIVYPIANVHPTPGQ